VVVFYWGRPRIPHRDYSPDREGYGLGRSAHTVRLRSVPLLSAANDSETHHEFETSETEVRFTSGF